MFKNRSHILKNSCGFSPPLNFCCLKGELCAVNLRVVFIYFLFSFYSVIEILVTILFRELHLFCCSLKLLGLMGTY